MPPLRPALFAVIAFAIAAPARAACSSYLRATPPGEETPLAAVRGAGINASIAEGLIFDWKDLTGNRDGLWHNESGPAGVTSTRWASMWASTSKADAAKWSAWQRSEHERLGAMRISSTGDPLVEALALQNLVRLDRAPGEFSDRYMGFRADAYSPAKQAYLQRWNARGPAQGVTLIVPGYNEAGQDWIRVADKLTQGGSIVYILDPPNQGFSSGDHAHLWSAKEWTRAYEEALGTVRSEARGLPVVVVAHSTGGGVAANELVDVLNGEENALIAGKPDGLVITSPLLALAPTRTNSIFNNLASGKLNSWSIPPITRLTDWWHGRAWRHQWQTSFGTRQSLSFIQSMKSLENQSQGWRGKKQDPGIPIAILHASNDRVTDPKASLDMAANWDGATYYAPNTTSGDPHGLAWDKNGFDAMMLEWWKVLNQSQGKDCFLH